MIAAIIQGLPYENNTKKLKFNIVSLHPPFNSRITLKSGFFYRGKPNVAAKVSELS